MQHDGSELLRKVSLDSQAKNQPGLQKCFINSTFALLLITLYFRTLRHVEPLTQTDIVLKNQKDNL